MSNHGRCNDSGAQVGAAVGGLALGLAVGAALGLLFAPQSGKETRKQIQKKAVDAKKQGEKLYKEYQGRAKRAASELKK